MVVGQTLSYGPLKSKNFNFAKAQRGPKMFGLASFFMVRKLKLIKSFLIIRGVTFTLAKKTRIAIDRNRYN